MKRIVICCDGTWNTPDEEEHGRSCATNVAKLAELVAPQDAGGVPQITYYHDGVGSGNLGDRIVGGAFGVGLSRNIEDCYRFLVANYLEGDEIWLFGFSRGAYTARSIVGLIRNSGLLAKKNLDRLPEAYDLYRDRADTTHPNSDRARKFRADFSLPDNTVRIQFLGVWDTVGSLGVPGHILHNLLDEKWEFHDVSLSAIVQSAYHALAIDEHRSDFKPCVWDGVNSAERQQVWFAGAHSDVGGGYPDAGLSDCALAWMMCKAEGCGLKLDRVNVDVTPDQAAKIHDSKTGIFSLKPDYVRPVSPGVLAEAALKKHAAGYAPKNWPAGAAPLPCAQSCTKPAAERCWG